MISIAKIRDIATKEKKKISRKAINKINQIIEENLRKIIRKASRNADFSGRKIIKEEDIE